MARDLQDIAGDTGRGWHPLCVKRGGLWTAVAASAGTGLICRPRQCSPHLAAAALSGRAFLSGRIRSRRHVCRPWFKRAITRASGLWVRVERVQRFSVAI